MSCKFCRGSGCIACPGEKAKAEAVIPEPIFTVRLDNEHDMKLLKQFFSRESIESGIVEGLYRGFPLNDSVELRGAVASLLQELHDEATGGGSEKGS